MCSIAGIVRGNGAAFARSGTQASATSNGVAEMLDVQKHRAPDDTGIYKDNLIELGMGRLKIIDLSSPGLCPYQEDEFVLCYNGEIYNYIELKKELQGFGWRFRTTSYTEVLMKAWRQWDSGMFEKLNGMFAFAVYNTHTKQLTLARDIAGEKPLYYYAKDDTFVFTSEGKALAKVMPLEHEESRFFDAFQHVHIDTLWKNVKEVPPAHYLTYDVRKNTHSLH